MTTATRGQVRLAARGQAGIPGRTIKRWVDKAGVWFRVVLDRAVAEARRVWEAARAGSVRASSGTLAHLARRDPDGHIREWPVGELSVFDASGERQPANRHAIALPALKAVYAAVGLELPAASMRRYSKSLRPDQTRSVSRARA